MQCQRRHATIVQTCSYLGGESRPAFRMPSERSLRRNRAAIVLVCEINRRGSHEVGVTMASSCHPCCVKQEVKVVLKLKSDRQDERDDQEKERLTGLEKLVIGDAGRREQMVVRWVV